MKISPEDSDLLQDLVREYDYPDFDPKKHVISSMFAEQLGITQRAAFDRLERLHHSGKLMREGVRLPGGQRAWGYYKN